MPSLDPDDPWAHKPGRYDERPLKRVLKRHYRLSSGRIGAHAGGAARTFYYHQRSVKVDAPKGKGGSVDYITREGDYGDRDDLVAVIGDPAELREALKAIEDSARVRRGRTAERVAIAEVMELPAGADPERWPAAAAALVDRWRQRGHLAIAAIHAPEDGQPHIHVLATSRPVTRTPEGWMVNRTARLFTSKSELREERQLVAGLINEACGQEVKFFGGRDREMDRPGIVGREPKRRVPSAVLHGKVDPDPDARRRAREKYQAAREARAAIAQPLAEPQQEKRPPLLEIRPGQFGADVWRLVPGREPIKLRRVRNPAEFDELLKKERLQDIEPDQVHRHPDLMDQDWSRVSLYFARRQAKRESEVRETAQSRRHSGYEPVEPPRPLMSASDPWAVRQLEAEKQDMARRLDEERRARQEAVLQAEAERQARLATEAAAKQAIANLVAEQSNQPTSAPPASVNQALTVFDLAHKASVRLDPDQPVSAPWAGQMIRHLQTVLGRPRSKPQSERD